ncbi:MAG: glycosyltransferase family 4 protein [Steroidobacteraceae bacterium]|nr:glycosyltransferase family 4 protein [Steroidobacteraceae bacterium]
MNMAVDNARLLILATDKYPPFRVDVTVLLARELVSRGFSIDWILQSERECRKPSRQRWGGGVVYVGQTDTGESRIRRLHKHVLDLLNDLRVLSLARNRDYDVIQVRDKALAALPAMWAARRSGAAFVYWLSFPHAESSTYLARAGLARYPVLYRIRGWCLFQLVYRFILPRADHIFVQSEQMKRDLASYGIPQDKMTPVPMGIELDDFNASLRNPAEAVEPATIGYLGTLAGERRIDFLVRCLALVLPQVPEARLLLVGGADRPTDEQKIRAEAQRLGVADRVEITGFVPRARALQLIARAAVCVSPFYPTPILNSTSPTKLVEYMALSKPVVANDHPEQRLVLEESRAGLCVSYDERAFANAIVSILMDPEEAARMGHRGREYVERNRDYRRLGAMLADKYREIIARGMRRELAAWKNG